MNNSSAKYYQKNKEMLLKKACERYQNLSEEDQKSSNMLANEIRTFLNMKNKGWLSIEKNYKNWKNFTQ